MQARLGFLLSRYTSGVLVVIGLCLFNWPDSVVRTAQAAPPPEEIAAAKKAFRAGQRLLEQQRYAEAIPEFKKAHQITKDDLVMGQIALAYEEAGDFEAALTAIEHYKKALPATEKASVAPMIAKYKKAIREGRTKKLRLVGEEVEPEPVAPIAPPQPAPVVTEPVSTPPVDAPSSDLTPKRKRLWTWIAAGVTGALGVSALAVGISAKAKYDDLKSTCGGACLDDDVDGVKTRAIATDVLLGLTAAAAIATTTLFFLEGRTASAELPGVAKASIRLAPMLSASQVGLGAHVTY